MYKIRCDLKALERAIEAEGSMQILAFKAGVSYQTVLNWKSTRSAMSPPNAVRVEEATGGKVTRRELLPDYPWDAMEKTGQSF